METGATVSPAPDEGRELPLPPFFDAERAAGAWSGRPDPQHLAALAVDWRRRHRLTPARPSGGTVLLLVDMQNDFCQPGASLFVGGRSGRGAIDDAARTARFIYHNLHAIDQVVCTLDSHVPFQIFFPAFWLERDRPPAPNREVLLDDLRAGALRPNPDLARFLAGGDVAWLERQVEFYCAELERQGRYTLFLWPPHCLVGGTGHALVNTLEEARAFHAFARAAENRSFSKGQDPLTESYSVLRPEVTHAFDGRPLWNGDGGLARLLLAAERIVIAGQASSHCVRSTVLDLLELFRREAPAQIERVALLEDCMSPVVVRDAARGAVLFDFSDRAEEALAACAAHGMRRLRSTAPIAAWRHEGVPVAARDR